MITSKTGFPLSLLVVAMFLVHVTDSTLHAGTRLYVMQNTSAGDDGLTWTTAFDHLTDALAAARDNPSVSEVWVAAGIYRPDESAAAPQGTGDRNASFVLPPNVSVFGGFAGGETSLLQRNFTLNVVTLSGDLAKNDIFTPSFGLTPPVFTNNAENAISVVRAPAASASARLDGVTVRDGNSFPTSPGDGIASGIEIEGSTPTIANCIIERHDYQSALIIGGNGNGLLDNCTFRQNFSVGASSTSGGVTVRNCYFGQNANSGLSLNGFSGTIVEGCTFYGNFGAGINSGASPLTIRNSRFVGNLAGGANLATCGGSILLHDCLFVGNSAGGGLILFCNCGGHCLVSHCTFYGNSSAINGGGIWTQCGLGDVFIMSCILSANTALGQGQQIFFQGNVNHTSQVTCVQHSNIEQDISELVWCNNSNVSASPMFVDPDGPDDILGTLDDNCRLAPGSPDIDTGSCVSQLACQQAGFCVCSEFDLDGNPRLWDGDDPDLDPEYDRGCYEYLQFCTQCPGPRVWVDASDGDFTDHVNWSYSAPGPEHEAVFNQLIAPYVVFFPLATPIQNQRLSVYRGNVTFDLNTASYELTENSPSGAVVLGAANLDVAGLSLIGGGALQAPTLRVASGAGSTAALTVSQAGTSVLITDETCIGCLGSGSLVVSDGAELTSFFATIGEQPGLNSSVLVTGQDSRFFVPFLLLVKDGSLTVQDNAIVDAGFGGMIILGSGSISGNSVIDGDMLTIGSISPGTAANPIGTLTLVGDLEQVGSIPGFGSQSGRLRIDVDQQGMTINTDRLQINGNALLGGGLIVTAPKEFAPQISDPPLDVLAADAIIDSFDVALVPAIDDGGTPRFLRVLYGANGSLAGGPGVSLGVQLLNISPGFGGLPSVDVDGLPVAAELGDFDGVNGPDLLIALDGPTPGSNGTLLILPNNGSGEFDELPLAQLPTGVNPRGLAVAQLAGSNLVDIAVACEGSSEADDSVQVLQNNGGFSFTNVFTMNSTQVNRPLDIAAGELQPGADIDIAVANTMANHVIIVRNFGGGVFTPTVIAPSGPTPSSCDPADIENDKDFDIVVGSAAASTVTVLRQTGAGSGAFSIGATINVGLGPVDVAVANLDLECQPCDPLDGMLEIITANTLDGTISVVVNTTASPTGSLSFAPAVNLEVGDFPTSFPSSLAAANLDFDPNALPEDQDVDIDLAVVAMVDGVPTVIVLRNDIVFEPGQTAQLTFAPAINLPAGTTTQFVLADDVDGDQADDLVAVNLPIGSPLAGPSTATVKVLPNTTLGTKKPACFADIDDSGARDIDDLLTIVNNWGALGANPADIAPSGGDGVVNIDDLLAVINAWGPCP